MLTVLVNLFKNCFLTYISRYQKMNKSLVLAAIVAAFALAACGKKEAPVEAPAPVVAPAPAADAAAPVAPAADAAAAAPAADAAAPAAAK
jgi:hypothetical protein